MKLYMFRTVSLSIIRSFHCRHSNDICHTACEQDQDVPSWFCSQAVSKPVWHIPLLCVQWKTADDGQKNCPKHVEFHSKNKFENLVHLVGFIVRIFYDARSPERQIYSVFGRLSEITGSTTDVWIKNITFNTYNTYNLLRSIKYDFKIITTHLYL
jgi:hypothetical protein